jgi:hypothetical protein
MLLSRFWYVVLALLLGAAMFVLYLATSMYNRASARMQGEGLSSDSQVVSWYLRDDARQRAAQLIPFALNQDIGKFLQESSDAEGKVPQKSRDKVRAALDSVNKKVAQELSFDAVFAVDQHGRVVAFLGYEQATGMEDFELGGYPVVADALHGYIRDDTLVLDRVYRVVARPVEHDTGSAPAGAVIGARIIDDRFARELSQRTGAAVAFYANGERVAAEAPAGMDKSQLDQIMRDLPGLTSDAEYIEKGRSQIRTIGKFLTVQYARLPGEAWELGAGYAVARLPHRVDGPLGFFRQADDKDKSEAKISIALLIVLLGAGLGILFSFVEHTRPLVTFRREAQRVAKGEADQLQPSKFRGVYRQIASDLNDGIDKVAAKGGVPRRAADLKQVLGDIPDQPQMSAFSFPGEATTAPGAPPPSAPGPLPGPPGKKPLPTAPSNPRVPKQHAPVPELQNTLQSEAASVPRPPPRVPSGPTSSPPGSDASADGEWRRVYEEFVATKQQCGENVTGFTFEKFEQTLRKNQEALVKRHGAKRVKFSVYVKDGKAALKASPVKD